MTATFTPGTPNWIDLTVDDTAAAQNFYGGLFGWDFVPGDTKGYTLCRLNGDTVAGLLETTEKPALWVPYFASNDIHTTVERISEAGGKIVSGPTQILDQGRLCIAQDPTGAVFGIWQGLKYPGVQMWGEPNSGAWIELNTTNGEAVDNFYRH